MRNTAPKEKGLRRQRWRSKLNLFSGYMIRFLVQWFQVIGVAGHSTFSAFCNAGTISAFYNSSAVSASYITLAIPASHITLPSQPYVAPSAAHHSSPATSSCQPSFAVPPSSQSTESTQPTKKIKKHFITVKGSGAVVGENQARWKSRSGHFIRSHIPFRYHDWRIVPKTFKDDVWNALMGEFELNIHPDLARPFLEKEFPQRFRTAKNIYRANILKEKTREEALAACPNGMDPGHWERFVAHEYNPRTIEKKAKNSANRKSNIIDHTCGRQSYAQIHHNEQLKNPELKIGRAHTWKKGHEHADGTVLESARLKYDEVTAAQEKRKNINGESSNNFQNLDSDELSEVFGPDSRNYVRGVSLRISRNQSQHIAVATELLDQESYKSVAKVEADVSDMKSKVNTMQGWLTAIFQQLTNIGT